MTSKMRPVSRLLSPSSTDASPSIVILATSALTATAASLFYAKSLSKTSLENNKHHQQSPSDNREQFKMDVDLMDRIAAKPYIPVTKTRSVPRKLRLLAIDVPELRTEGIDGECRVNLNRVFSDGIAPPKVIAKEQHRGDGDSDMDNIKVVQKSFAHALAKCRHRDSLRIGVEITEASVSDLNPNNLRRTYQFGSFRYDPGKWSKATSTAATEATTTTTTGDSKRSTSSDGGNVESDDQRVDDDLDVVETRELKDTNEQQPKPGSTEDRKHDTAAGDNTVLATEEDEYDAPWNQYAWIQELQLRIGGKVAFGEPMQPSSRIQRLLFGSVYKTTIPSSRAPWEYLLLPIFHRNPAGQDAPNKKNWASNKPHAVIANGAAMQRVPGSLRLLQNVCNENEVPLFIINDPRVWGLNTHQDLPEALMDMRKAIKQKIVVQAMENGSAFSRGRVLGQAETEAKWQARDVGRRTRQAVRDANEKIKKERENDWSQLKRSELQAKLVERKVIELPDGKEQARSPEYTKAMIELSRQCIADEEELRQENTPPGERATAEVDPPDETSETPKQGIATA